MFNRRIVITGIGLISPAGIGKEVFSESILNGISGIRPISIFDPALFNIKTAGEVKDFKPEVFLGGKGLRTLDRSTKLISSAALLALKDANITVDENNTHDIGMVVANTLGSACSISEFDKTAMLEGVQYVNPALFSNTVINSPASQAAIRCNIKGLNATISTGCSASLDAIKYAVDFLRLGRAKLILAGGVEELCVQTLLGFYKVGLLSGLNNNIELSCPFDKRRNGVVLGEGAGFLVLEDLASAIERKATIYAEILGYGQSLTNCNLEANDNRENILVDSFNQAMVRALSDAQIKANDIDYISSSANSTKEIDSLENKAIKNLFADDNLNLKVTSIKSMTGECYSVMGLLQVASAVASIDKNLIPPTINYQQVDNDCNLNYVLDKAHSCNVNKVLINTFGFNGCNSSLVVSRINNN